MTGSEPAPAVSKPGVVDAESIAIRGEPVSGNEPVSAVAGKVLAEGSVPAPPVEAVSGGRNVSVSDEPVRGIDPNSGVFVVAAMPGFGLSRPPSAVGCGSNRMVGLSLMRVEDPAVSLGNNSVGAPPRSGVVLPMPDDDSAIPIEPSPSAGMLSPIPVDPISAESIFVAPIPGPVVPRSGGGVSLIPGEVASAGRPNPSIGRPNSSTRGFVSS